MLFFICGCIFSLFSSKEPTNLEQAQVALQKNEPDSAYVLVEKARAENRKESAFIHSLYMQVAKALVEKADPVSKLLVDKKPTKELISLLSQDGLYDPQDTLDALVQKTQKKWIRVVHGSGNKEYRDLVDSSEQKQAQKAALQFAEDIDLFQAKLPFVTRYDYAVIGGSFLPGLRARIAFLVELWNQGIRFDSLYFLTGERTLRKGENEPDAVEILVNEKISPLAFKQGWQMPENVSYETEYDMCRLVWDSLDIPQEMLQALHNKVFFIYAKCPPGQERISLKDGYRTWLNEIEPKPGSVLAISHPLFWISQQVTAESILGKDFVVDTCAPKPSDAYLKENETRIVSFIQDTVAKTLYEASKR